MKQMEVSFLLFPIGVWKIAMHGANFANLLLLEIITVGALMIEDF